MKLTLLFSILISTSAMAIDFHKVTGSFDVLDKDIHPLDSEVNLAYGSFTENSEASRSPASVEDHTETSSSVTEVTGSFE